MLDDLIEQGSCHTLTVAVGWVVVVVLTITRDGVALGVDIVNEVTNVALSEEKGSELFVDMFVIGSTVEFTAVQTE